MYKITNVKRIKYSFHTRTEHDYTIIQKEDSNKNLQIQKHSSWEAYYITQWTCKWGCQAERYRRHTGQVCHTWAFFSVTPQNIIISQNFPPKWHLVQHNSEMGLWWNLSQTSTEPPLWTLSPVLLQNGVTSESLLFLEQEKACGVHTSPANRPDPQLLSPQPWVLLESLTFCFHPSNWVGGLLLVNRPPNHQMIMRSLILFHLWSKSKILGNCLV